MSDEPRSTQRLPPEPLRRIDWLAIAPWLILFRCPSSTLGWPWVIGAIGAVLLGGFDIDAPTDFRYRWPEFRDPIWPIPATEVSWTAFGRLVGWVGLGLIVAKLAASKLTRSRGGSVHGAIAGSVARLPVALAGGFGLIAPAALSLSVLTAVVGWLGTEIPAALAAILALAAIPLVAAVVVVAVSWPLLVGAVAVDRSDAFEAASRQLAYATQRPFQAAFYVGVATAIGYAASVPIELLLSVAQGWLLSTATEVSSETASLNAGFAFAARVVRGFYPAYFFTAATAIYLLLRHDIDGQPINEMAIPKDQSTPPA